MGFFLYRIWPSYARLASARLGPQMSQKSTNCPAKAARPNMNIFVWASVPKICREIRRAHVYLISKSASPNIIQRAQRAGECDARPLRTLDGSVFGSTLAWGWIRRMAPTHRCFVNRYYFEYRQWDFLLYGNPCFLCVFAWIEYIHANVFLRALDNLFLSRSIWTFPMHELRIPAIALWSVVLQSIELLALLNFVHMHAVCQFQFIYFQSIAIFLNCDNTNFWFILLTIYFPMAD